MIAVDTNLLVYAHRRDVEWHEQARDRIASLAGAGNPWAIPWPCVHEFLAVVTHPKIFRDPTPRPRAIEQIETWMASPELVLIRETASHWSYLRSLVEVARITGPKVHDARIAALCMQHGVSELWSADRDLSAFPRLNVVNPLVR